MTGCDQASHPPSGPSRSAPGSRPSTRRPLRLLGRPLQRRRAAGSRRLRRRCERVGPVSAIGSARTRTRARRERARDGDRRPSRRPDARRRRPRSPQRRWTDAVDPRVGRNPAGPSPHDDVPVGDDPDQPGAVQNQQTPRLAELIRSAASAIGEGRVALHRHGNLGDELFGLHDPPSLLPHATDAPPGGPEAEVLSFPLGRPGHAGDVRLYPPRTGCATMVRARRRPSRAAHTSARPAGAMPARCTRPAGSVSSRSSPSWPVTGWPPSSGT